MSAHTEALKQARAALVTLHNIDADFADDLIAAGEQFNAAIAAIDAAVSLPDPSAAPVVPFLYFYQHDETGRTTTRNPSERMTERRWHEIPLYAAPPQTLPDVEPVGEVAPRPDVVDWYSYEPEIGTKLYTALPPAPLTDERERLCAEQGKAVMPLIGPLLDAWENADREVMAEEPELAKWLTEINRAMETAGDEGVQG